MKYFTLLLAFIIIGCSTSKQIVLTSNQYNVLYKGTLNPIKINNGNLKEYNISISNGTIKEINEDKVVVLIDTTTTYETTLSLEKKGLITKFDFRIKRFPKPEIRFFSNGKGDNNNMTIAEFKSVMMLSKSQRTEYKQK
jgi:hypothetical protein